MSRVRVSRYGMDPVVYPWPRSRIDDEPDTVIIYGGISAYGGATTTGSFPSTTTYPATTRYPHS